MAYGGLLNKAELQAEFTTKINDNGSNDVSPADIRDCLNNIVDSYEPNSVALVGTSTSFAVTSTPAKFTAFSAGGGSMPSGIVTASSSTDDWTFVHGCAVQMDLLFNGEWSNNQTLTIEIRKNGLASTILPVTVDGEGGGKPVSVFSLGVLAGVATDTIEVYVTGESNFTVTQLGIQVVAIYLGLSVANT